MALFIVPYLTIPVSIIYAGRIIYRNYKLEHTDPIYIAKRLEREKCTIRAKQYEANYLAEQTQKPIQCPKCSSTQITSNKNGFSVAKGITGALLTGGIGLFTGFHGNNRVNITCLKCGHNWRP